MVERLKGFGNTLSMPVLRSFVLNFLKWYLSKKSFDKLSIYVFIIFAKLEVLPKKVEVVDQKKKKRTPEVFENLRQIMEGTPSSSLRHLSFVKLIYLLKLVIQ
ncbi:hypothetical protein BDFB_015160 [Asbolus verrucosus]|uniref:Uncharacterized protein n=1 Tax=Asbolus verrucosus TaxID=1661398 RepID=A0A482V9L9_ASBVE|nr:hypothetical protein BDFB_015160 [Asbolus verrucosus]